MCRPVGLALACNQFALHYPRPLSVQILGQAALVPLFVSLKKIQLKAGFKGCSLAAILDIWSSPLIIRIVESKQTLALETIGVDDQHSHTGGKMHARKSAPGVGGGSPLESEGSANDESGI
jgi:hypothetical protein